MNRWISQHFLQQGRKNGVPPDVLKHAVATANALLIKSPQLPPLFSLRHIAHETGVPYVFLREVIERRNYKEPNSNLGAYEEPYRVFKLKKQKVGHSKDRFRFICVPHPLLLKVQRWINREILAKVPTHEASFAYVHLGGVVPAAKLHTDAGCKWLIKLDVTNFFESILETDVYRVFNELGYQPLVAFELARLCTRVRARNNPIDTTKRGRDYPGLPYKDVRIGHLPQGAATSPLLSNLASRPLDATLLSFAQQEELVYTRYADDLTFSSNTEFSRAKALELVHKVYGHIREHGLWPNKAKTKIVPPGARKIVLGLLVDGATPRLNKEFKARVRTHIHFLLRKDMGPTQHAHNRGFNSVLGLQRHVYGLVAYAAGVEPMWAHRAKMELAKVDWPEFDGF